MVKLPTPNWRDLWQTISTHKGLVALVVFLIVVTLTNLPAVNHWLAGWDNFSVSLNLPLNLERTFFATWREYRGFGVPSDSEVADVFRQLPLFALSTFLPDWTVEWIYYFGMYWLGAIGAFFLTQSLVKGIAPFRLTNHGLELAGLVGALAYATNLYTIDVFYFPITLYVVRHGLLPWILWSTHQLLIQSKPSPKLWLWFGLIILLASPGALTATVFFITALMIGLLLLCFGSWQRKLQVGAVLIALQAFWLLPFTNYFLEKSVDITKASTFVPINEMLLNQPFERFSFDRLLTFSTDFTSGAPFKDVSGESVVVHPGLSYTPIGTLPPLAYWSIWIPTLLGIITLLIWQAQHRTWRYSWIIGLLLIGIFLLRKEYPPVGKLFEWLGEHIKVLKVVLRFGGAKLNPILIISTSILSGLAAVGLHELTSKLHRQIPRLILRSLTIISCIAAVSWMGWYALTGSLYFSVMSVEIPDAYFQAAKSINNDPDYGRVLQLPYGVHSYWRSHTFGYYGSSFLAFLLKKPLQDKTFNPGNLDHNAFDQTLTKLIANTSQLTSTARANRATEFANFLARTNTTYLVWDPTVSTFIRTHALTTWELLPTADTDALMQALLDNHLATILGQYELSEWAQPLPTAINNPDVTLKVIKLNTTQAMIASPTIATAIDSIGTEPFTPTLNAIPTTLIQTQKLPARIYPWWQPTAFLTPQDQFLQLTSPTADITKSWQLKNQILQPVTENEYVGVDVFAHYEKQQLAIYFRPTPLPFTPKLVDQSVEPDLLISIPITSWNNPNSKVAYDSYLNNWHVLGDHQTNQFRLSINDQVIPLPANLGEETDYLTSMLLPLGDLRQLPVSLLIADPIAAEQDRQFSGNYFSLTPDPNCWLDKYANFASTFGTSQNTIEATTSHGTLCFGASIDLDQPTQDIAKSKTTDKRRYFELEFVPTITSQLIQTDKTNFPLTNQRELQDQQISEPMISELFVCLMSTATGDCLNQQRFLKSTSPASVRVTSQRLFTEPKLHILMTLPTFGAETQQLHIDHLKLIGFSPQMSSYVSLDATKYATPQVNTDLHLPTISIPYFLSAGSLYTNRLNLEFLANRKSNMCRWQE